MNKEEVIGVLTDILEGCTYQGDVEIETPDEDAALKCAIEAVGNYHKWIPVTERLPDKDGEYLTTEVWASDTYVNAAEYHKRNGWHICSDKVVAWKPMPEPYRPPEMEDVTKSADGYADQSAMMPAT